MAFGGVHAGGKGVQPLDAVGQPVLDQKVQRAIGHWGLPPIAAVGQTLKNLVGPQRLVRF